VRNLEFLIDFWGISPEKVACRKELVPHKKKEGPTRKTGLAPMPSKIDLKLEKCFFFNGFLKGSENFF